MSHTTSAQGRRVIAELKRKPMTYRQMLDIGISNSPWKRCTECLDPTTESLLRVKGADGLIRWRVLPVRVSVLLDKQ